MKIKKIIVILTALLFLTLICGCSEKFRLDENVSRLRSNAFFDENENYLLYAFPEIRETPMIADGVINKTEKTVILKLKLKYAAEGEFTVNFTTDKEYSETFAFSAFSDCFVTSVKVNMLPYKPFNATITHNGESQTLYMESLLNEKTVTADVALKKAYKAKKDYVDKHTVNGVFDGEIYIRLITENDKNYWYVGFTTKEQTLCLLLNDKGELVDERTIPNPS